MKTPGKRGRTRSARPAAGRRFWRRLLWALIFPARTQRVAATVPGIVLIGLALGVGVAAYNSSSNILFVTLALLLGCLILSGILSWLNFRAVSWRLEVEPPMRAGREHPVVLYVANGKRLLPTYALSFEVKSTSTRAPRHLGLHGRLDPRGETKIEWTISPERRGMERVEVVSVGSSFPFGFLKKSLAAEVACDVIVWPAPIEYRRFPVAAWQRLQPGDPVPRAGHGGDLLALRKYQAGDSHRQIHWKMSARTRQLMVRQFSADSPQGFSLRVETAASLWKNADQFEVLCSFAATLAEDLFQRGQLGGVAIGREPFRPVRTVGDFEEFLDRMAILQPASDEALETTSVHRAGGRHVLTFVPEGTRGVIAYVDGEKAAAA